MPWGKATADGPVTAREAFGKLTLDDLRPLAGLVLPDPPKKKGELVPRLAAAMTDPARVRALYDRLEPAAREAVRAAVADPAGRLDREKFRAHHGSAPRFDDADPDRPAWAFTGAERRAIHPSPLRLFLPWRDLLPTDTRAVLRVFVPPPEPFAVPTGDDPPAVHTVYEHVWGGGKAAGRDVPVRVRATAAEAVADVRAVLRLIDGGKVRVTDKKRVPTEAARRAVAGVLAGGDFYAPADADEVKQDPAHDLGIKAFAWPVLAQAGGLAEPAGDALRLTAAGRRALTTAPADVLRGLWARWLKAGGFDEFARVEVIKGQGRAALTAAAGRRAVVADALAAVPVGRWFDVEHFFRLLRATGRTFALTRHDDDFELYIAEPEYGNLGYLDDHAWEQLQGRFVLAFLFEYAATLGAIDVAYVPPQGVRHDFQSRWGADDLSCLSRYDGLLRLRVNPLGAWLLGSAAEYRPAPPTRVESLRVLANLDVVAAGPLPAADRLTLERFADPASDGVWKLSAGRVLRAVEEGRTVDELADFLATRAVGELPAAAAAFLADVRAKAGRLADAGLARLIACADEFVAAELAADRRLAGKCLRAGDRYLVIRLADLPAAREAARRLGYVWPVPSD